MLRNECVKLQKSHIRIGLMDFSVFRSLVHQMKGKYSLTTKKFRVNNVRWLAYWYLRRRGLVKARGTLDALALNAYRSDLSGIVGLMHHAGDYDKKMTVRRNKIIDLIISIVLRSIALSLFIPTFLIRSVNRLEEGAVAIGKGKFDSRIKLSGTDELGRLADIINIMASNLENAQREKLIKLRMEDELKTAREIQKALLPEKLPQMKGYQFAAYYAAQTEASGDYYDLIPLGDDKMGIAIADVSGHGVGSGLVMIMTRTLLHVYSNEIDDPRELLSKLNEYLHENTATNYFVTMFYGILDTSGTISYSSAGHHPCLRVTDKGVREFPAGGIALGALEKDFFDEHATFNRISLNKGDYLIQATDGIIESMNESSEEYGSERFYQVLKDSYGKKPEEMIHAVLTSVKRFTGSAPQQDDITIIALRVA